MSDHQEILEPIRKMLEKMLENDRALALPSVSAHTKAMRAVWFLEDMSMWLWQQVGPNLDDEIAVEYDRRVADIAEYVGLPPREG